jgi:arsenate reductase (glutaredoxin)
MGYKADIPSTTEVLSVQVQILGTQKSNATKKAIRFFSERQIAYHFRDLREKGFSAGELENIRRSIDPDDLVDIEGQVYKKRGMAYMAFDATEELLEEPLLAKLPVVRYGKSSTAGYEPDAWKEWIASSD